MTAPINNTNSLAITSQNLDALHLQARQSPTQALHAAAQQFESVFMNMMLKSMREATPQDGMFDSEQTQMFTSMLDQQLAQNMSAKGVGLADLMVKQLSRNMGATANATSQHAAPTGEVQTPALPASAHIPGTPYPTPVNQRQQNFVQRMMPAAIQASRKSGIPVQMMLGQAALESGWGRREIRMPDGSHSYNLFGIKAGPNWQGGVVEVMTTEYRNGIAQQRVEKFRAYDSYAQAFNDYARLISRNPRYADAMQQLDDVQGYAQAMQQGGYATDPRYAEKLAQVIGQVSDQVSGLA